MKKTILLLWFLVLASCGSTGYDSGYELTQQTILSHYDSESRELDLSHLGIKGFITLGEYLSWSVINTIDISGNDIQKLDLSAIDTLVWLDASGNDIIFSSDISLPESIRHIDISENGLRDLKNFQHLSKLKTLNLSSNSLEDNDMSLKNFPKIEYVNIENNVLITWELQKFINQLNNAYEFKWEKWYTE